MLKLSVVIPVYNEENAIAEAVAFFKEFTSRNLDCEVIFVNDASTDNTASFFTDLKHDRIRVITHSQNKGYGAALKSGLKQARGDYIAITDADASYPNNKIIALFNKLVEDNADMVVGARQSKSLNESFFRRLTKGILRRLAMHLSEEEIPDLNSGLRVIKKDLLSRFLKLLPNGFSFTSTITLALLANHCRIIYVPIDYYQRKGKSKIRPIKDTLNFLQLIIRTVMFFNPLKVFLPLSIIFFLLSLGVLIISYLLGQVMDITTIILFTTAFNLLAIGLLADLIDKRMS